MRAECQEMLLTYVTQRYKTRGVYNIIKGLCGAGKKELT